MKAYILFLGLTVLGIGQACAQKAPAPVLVDLPPVITNPSAYNALSPQESRVILAKGTEWAFSGAFHDSKEAGFYLCKQCNLPLFSSHDKFDSGSGWPSFDDMIESNVREMPDADGSRTEIVCANCGGHLGHVFRGEGFTPKMTRHCVNSLSLSFVPAVFAEAPKATGGVQPIDEYVAGKGYEQYGVATFAGGCFWCTEAAFERIEGVVDVISGYSGGKEEYPSYEKVANGETAHAESIMVYYDRDVIDFGTLLEVFFVAHDPTQLNRQGPDVGPQYRSAIFYHDKEQKKAAQATIARLNASGKLTAPIVTELAPYSEFWVAEAYHQDYYGAHPENPYVQRVSRPKVEKVEKEFARLLKPAYRQ